MSFKQLKLTASGQAFSQRQREVGHPTPFTPFASSFGVLASDSLAGAAVTRAAVGLPAIFPNV